MSFPNTGKFIPPPPSWVPKIGNTVATIYADFTTEATTDHYFYNGGVYGSFAAWLTAIGGTFTRGSSAYYTNSSGFLASASTDVPRFDYNPSTLAAKGILLEGASTNNYLQSNNFSVTWSGVAGGNSLSQNVTGPDGVANSGWTTTSGGFNGWNQNRGLTVDSATPYVSSFYAKKGTSTHAFICAVDNAGTNAAASYFDINAGTVGTQNQTVTGSPGFVFSNGTITAVAGGWYRLSTLITQASGSDVLGNMQIGICDADASRASTAGNTGLMYGAQYEQASFLSSYISSTSGTATRAADTLRASYAISAPISTFISLNSNSPGSGSGIWPAVFYDGTTNNFIEFTRLVATIKWQGVNATVTVENIDSGVTPAVGTQYKIAQRAASANYGGAINGTSYTTNTGTNGAPGTGLNTLDIGQFAGNGQAFYGTIAQLGVWTVAATDAQLRSLTS